MRTHLLVSTAALGVMLTSSLAYAQAAAERKDEPKRTEESTKSGAAPPRQEAQHSQEAKERAHGSQEQTRKDSSQGNVREEKDHSRQATEEKNSAPSASEHDQSKAKEQAREAREPSRDRDRQAEESAKQRRETDKSSAEKKPQSSSTEKSRAETDKSRNGTSAEKNERSGAAASQNEHDQKQPPKNSAQQQTPGQEGNRPATASDANRPAAGDRQNVQSTPDARANQADRTNDTENRQQSRVSSEKQVRISETLSREHLAQPERDLNISIRVGEAVPSRVHLHRLPPEIISIEPEYRDYEYFSTDEDIVIVDPGSHRIVSEVPRDPSRARAQLSGGSGMAGGSMPTASSSNVECKIMRRDASGNVTEVSPSTVGSNSRTESLSVTVQLPGGGSSAPITLGTSAGDIVVATQGHGDCTVTLEPLTR